MTEDDLKEYIPKCGDRIALINFCYKNSPPLGSSAGWHTISLIEKLKKGKRSSSTKAEDVDSIKCNAPKRSNKRTSGRPPSTHRKIQLGWICNGVPVRQKSGGGTRTVTVSKADK